MVDDRALVVALALVGGLNLVGLAAVVLLHYQLGRFREEMRWMRRDDHRAKRPVA
jgi:hypothetical protein